MQHFAQTLLPPHFWSTHFCSITKVFHGFHLFFPSLVMIMMTTVHVVELVVLLAVPLVRARPTHLKEKSLRLIS